MRRRFRIAVLHETAVRPGTPDRRHLRYRQDRRGRIRREHRRSRAPLDVDDAYDRRDPQPRGSCVSPRPVREYRGTGRAGSGRHGHGGASFLFVRQRPARGTAGLPDQAHPRRSHVGLPHRACRTRRRDQLHRPARVVLLARVGMARVASRGRNRCGADSVHASKDARRQQPPQGAPHLWCVDRRRPRRARRHRVLRARAVGVHLGSLRVRPEYCCDAQGLRDEPHSPGTSVRR